MTNLARRIVEVFQFEAGDLKFHSVGEVHFGLMYLLLSIDSLIALDEFLLFLNKHLRIS